MLHFCSLDVLLHELPVEVRPQRVVDELGLLLVRLGPGAVLEDDVVVPAPLDPKVGLLRRAGVAVLHEGVAGEDVLHPDLLLVRAALVLLEELRACDASNVF